MSGLEVAAAVFGVVAGTIDLIHKSIEIYDAVKDKSKIPKALRKVSDKLPSIEELLRGAQAQYKEGKLNKIDKQTWDNAKHEIVKCNELCQELHDLVLSAYPEADSGKAERLWKGTKTVFSGKGKSAEVLLKEIWEYLALLAERQIINNTALLEDIKSLVDGLTGREGFTQQHSGSGHNIGGDNYEQHGDGEMFTGNMGSVTFNKAIHFHATPNVYEDQCLRDLRVTDPSKDRARIQDDKDKLLRSCYAWILEDVEFQRWQAHREPRLLWIKGDPGKGKTMMTIGLIDELSKSRASHTVVPAASSLNDNSTPLLAFFFCQDTIPILNNATSVLRGLIYMLAVQSENLLRYVQEEYVVAGKQSFEGHNAIYSLRGILSNMLNDASLPPTYLLVDALDECTFGLSDLLNVITDDSIRRQSKVKWLLTSRDTPGIKRYLQPDSRGVKISLEVQANNVSRAVAAFVDYKLQHLAEIQLYDADLRAEVKQQLCDRAEGTFLWVALVCKELESVPLYRTREVLRGLPRGLDPLYNRMMTQIEAQDPKTLRYCKNVLQSITLAIRPLRLEELAIMASLPTDQFGNVQAVIDLVSRCGSFLTVREGIVSFVHLSAKDYFTLGSGQQVLDVAMEEGQRRIADRLLDAMDSMLQRDMCNLQKPGVRIQDATSQIRSSSLLQIGYACEYWVEHIQAGGQACSGIMADGGKVHSFLQVHLLHWLEAMSLLQRMPVALAAIQKLFSILSGAKSTSLSDFIHDAIRFSMRGGPGIQEAPLQAYCSALVFAPKMSLVRKNFAQEMPGWIESILGLDEDWGPLWQTIEGHTDGVTSITFSVAGDRLASASQDKTVRIWDANTGQPLHTLKGHTGFVSSVTFLAADDQLASASHDKTVQIWDTRTGQPLYTLKGHTSCVNSVAFSAASQRLASASDDKTVWVWDAKTGKPLYTLQGHTSYVTSVAFSATGDRLASASCDGLVRLWNTKIGQPLHTLKGHTDSVTSVAFSAVGGCLASASEDRSIRVWNGENGGLLCILRGHTLPVNSVTFSPMGNRLASASQGGTVRVWDAITEQTLHSFEGHTDSVSSVAFSQQGDWLASASADHTVQVWDAKLQKMSRSNKGHARYVYGVVFSPQGELLASASEDMTVRIWDTSTGIVLRTLEGHTDSVNSVAFSAAGDRLASASYDRTVRVWDVETGQPLHTFKRTGWVSSVAFSEDGSHLETDQGSMLLPLAVLSASTLTHRPLAQRVSVTDRWLTMDSEDILWIPANFEPSCTVVRSSQVAFGYSSGKVILIALS